MRNRGSTTVAGNQVVIASSVARASMKSSRLLPGRCLLEPGSGPLD
jgi:hypothetical protein